MCLLIYSDKSCYMYPMGSCYVVTTVDFAMTPDFYLEIDQSIGICVDCGCFLIARNDDDMMTHCVRAFG